MKVTVVFCFDEAYAGYAAVAVVSLIINSKSDVKIYFMVTNAKSKFYDDLRDMCDRFLVEYEFIDIDRSDINIFHSTPRISNTTFIRTFIPLYINEPKVIYIDVDTLIVDDLTSLLNIDFGDSLIAGVHDSEGMSTSIIPEEKKRIYLNSGVLVWNLEKFNQEDYINRIVYLYNENPNAFLWQDQCLLNDFFSDNKILINDKWNRLIHCERIGKKTFFELAETSSILHFTGHIKPWMSWCNPTITEYWLKYARFYKIPSLDLLPIDRIDKLIWFSNQVQLNGDLDVAIKIKDDVINKLLSVLNEYGYNFSQKYIL